MCEIKRKTGSDKHSCDLFTYRLLTLVQFLVCTYLAVFYFFEIPLLQNFKFRNYNFTYPDVQNVKKAADTLPISAYSAH